MGSDQQYTLHWNDYRTHLVTSFEDLLTSKEFVDVTLGCEGKKLSAHKMLLSSCSPYFRELLRDNLCQHPIIVLSSIAHADMEALVQFMYNGQVNVSQDQLKSFLKAAEILKIQGLSNGENYDDNEVEKNAEACFDNDVNSCLLYTSDAADE